MIGQNIIQELILMTDRFTKAEIEIITLFLKEKETPVNNHDAVRYYIKNINCLMFAHRNITIAAKNSLTSISPHETKTDVRYGHDIDYINAEIESCRDLILYHEGISAQQNHDKSIRLHQNSNFIATWAVITATIGIVVGALVTLVTN